MKERLVIEVQYLFVGRAPARALKSPGVGAIRPGGGGAGRGGGACGARGVRGQGGGARSFPSFILRLSSSVEEKSLEIVSRPRAGVKFKIAPGRSSIEAGAQRAPRGPTMRLGLAHVVPPCGVAPARLPPRRKCVCLSARALLCARAARPRGTTQTQRFATLYERRPGPYARK